jgi:asparagine synthase (glutamine-hydrolysing)
MCGIAGIVDRELAAREIAPIVRRMTDAIVHRGPDDDGAFVTDGAGIGMRRLSIIDVAGGKQPIASEDGATQVVLNGELYNYQQLRATLIGRGHVFRTRSDTEVIVHGYEESGPAAVADLRGMFGLAVWDQRARALLLARDRLGKKPLFYALRRNRLLFGSEIKALLAADPTLAEPDPEAWLPYFQYGFVPEPRTMFRDIRKLPAAHYLVYQDGRLRIEPYWRLTFSDGNGGALTDARRAREELDALLEEAVRIRLMSEVPLGVFLSGGLDSSTIVAYAHRAGLRPLKTFTIGFDRQAWDESADAELVARHFGTEHHVLPLREQDLSADLPATVLTLVRHFDEPFGDPSALPTYYVSKLAREHVTVILSGDGGDELFAGYSSYRGIRFAERWQRLPAWLGRDLAPAVADGVAACLPAGWRYGAQRAAKVLRDSVLPFESMYFSKGRLCGDGIMRRVFSADAIAPLAHSNSAIPRDITRMMASTLPLVSKAGYADVRFRLLEDMLVKVDRMSMAHSLEVRSPLLDHHLVEFAARLHPALKLRGWEGKAILRDTVKGLLPRATLRKRKHGFSVPLREWLRSGLHEMVGDYLESANSRLPSGMFDEHAIRTILAEHRRGEVDHSSIVWLLLNYAAWHDLYVGSRRDAAPRRPAGSVRFRTARLSVH